MPFSLFNVSEFFYVGIECIYFFLNTTLRMATGRVSLRGYLKFTAEMGRYIETSLVWIVTFPKGRSGRSKIEGNATVLVHPSSSSYSTKRLKTALEVTRRSFSIQFPTSSLFTPMGRQNLNLNSNSFLMSVLPWLEIHTSYLWHNFLTYDMALSMTHFSHVIV